jgi:hypothetical protein
MIAALTETLFYIIVILTLICGPLYLTIAVLCSLLRITNKLTIFFLNLISDNKESDEPDIIE